ncbi:MAG: hypothetical protein ABSA16_07530 [Thermoguttaceae bacterium]|jgi:hypothetical protein
MYSRFFNIAVCLMWLSTMTWLITQKVMPSLWVGQPPNYQTIIESQKREPVGWKLWINNKQLGWALSTLEEQGQGPKEIRSYIHFNELPLEEFTSGWGRALFRLIEQPSDKYEMDVQNTLTIDSLGKLLRFDSKIQLDPLNTVLRMQGIVDGPKMHVEVRSGDFSYTSDVSLPQHALLNDALSPQTQLPNLAVGQTWTVPAISPLRPMSNLMEILHATVEEKEPIYWNSVIYDAWLVVYRNDPGMSFGANSRTRGKLWVLEDGTVIKQQAMIFDCLLSFVRMSSAETARLVKKCKQRAENDE